MDDHGFSTGGGCRPHACRGSGRVQRGVRSDRSLVDGEIDRSGVRAPSGDDRLDERNELSGNCAARHRAGVPVAPVVQVVIVPRVELDVVQVRDFSLHSLQRLQMKLSLQRRLAAILDFLPF